MSVAAPLKPAETVDAARVPIRWNSLLLERAHEVGLFSPAERLELIRGSLYQMSPIGVFHTTITGGLLRMLFDGLTKEDAVIFSPGAMRLSDDTEPQPDICILRPPLERYDRYAAPADVLFLVEVSDSSLSFDLTTKAMIYAQSGIAEYWVVDIAAKRVVVHRLPRPDGTWENVVSRRVGDELSPLAFPALSLKIEQIFSPRN